MMFSPPKKKTTLLLLGIIFLFFVSAQYINAGVVEELKGKISNKATDIKALEKEIEEQQKHLDEVSREKTSLQKAVKVLDISRDRIKTNINITENKIDKSTLTIEKLNTEIKDKNAYITENKKRLAYALRMINTMGDNTLAELVLASESVSDYWDEVEQLESFQDNLNKNINALIKIKEELEHTKSEREIERDNLNNLKDGYEDQKKIADQNRNEKNSLLSKTKNKESNYKKMLEEKLALKKQFEQELLDIEAQLQFALDPNSLPPEGSSALAWPLDNIYVTQMFGYTEGGKRLYKTGWHNGVDFRARTPLPVKAAASGVVLGTGDTDLTCNGASFGKWVLIRHFNGLSTVYAHLSLIKVTEGQKVGTGDVVGYSGNTGYSTAAHLHMGVYASDGVSVKQMPSRACGGKTYTLPLAAHSAYLDPMAYLPPYNQ